jgi:hypothetical protein
LSNCFRYIFYDNFVKSDNIPAQKSIYHSLLSNSFRHEKDRHDLFGIIRLKDGQATVVDRIEIKDEHGNPVLEPGQIGSSEEIPLSETGFRNPYGQNGLDPEEIACDPEKNFWICDVNGLKMVAKQKILDLREHGWTAEKVEGLTVLNDHRTIVVIIDNDFGLSMQVADRLNAGPTELTQYRMTGERRFTYDGKPAQPKFNAVPLNQNDCQTVMWVIKMPDNLQQDKAGSESPKIVGVI